MPQVAAYVRYSSDRQREASAADQIALLTRLATTRGWPAPTVYADPALSGTHTDRPELQHLLRDADGGRVDILLLEDLSRLSRDLGETDRLVKRLAFAGVRILSANGFDTDNEWSRMQVGLEGLMNEAYIRDLGARTHRGQAGAMSRGQSTGGRSYGYRSEPVMGPDGQLQGYRRTIHPEEAAIVRRIYQRYADGASAYRIAHELNADGIPGPRSGTWSRSSIYPDPKRPNVGIIGNPIYQGTVIWNRTRWAHVPGSKRRQAIDRPPNEWVRMHQPDLVLVHEALWEAAQAQIHRQAYKPGRRGTGLLTGILKCGTCGANYITVNATRFGCAAHHDRGPTVCAQSLTVERQRTERKLLEGIKADLCTPEAIRYFCAELTRLQAAYHTDPGPIKARIRDAQARAQNILRAIEAGIWTDSTKDALEAAERDGRTAQGELDQLATPTGGPLEPRIIHRRLVAALDQIEDKIAARQALGEILGEVQIVATDHGPVARIDQGRALAALVENSGSGGRLRPFPTWVEFAL